MTWVIRGGNIRLSAPFARLIFAVMLSAAFSGCSTPMAAFEKSFNRSIAIERRCREIQDAIPIENAAVRNDLVEAVTQSLLGTCRENRQKCLKMPADPRAPADLIDASVVFRTDTQKIISMSKSGTAAAWTPAAAALRDKYDKESAQLALREAAVLHASNALIKDLKNLRASFLEQSDTCVTTNNCGAKFIDLLIVAENDLPKNIRKLQDALAQLTVSAQAMSELAIRMDEAMRDVIHQETVVVSTEMLAFQQSLRAYGIASKQASNALAALLENGANDLRRLASAPAKKAVTELMAARLYGKASVRILGMIDNSLAQLDHTIDKMDQHLYGGATIATQLYAGDMQKTFDRIYQQYILKNNENMTLQLAFADAACQRLGFGTDDAPPPHNNSMFSPFLYGALVNIKLDLVGDVARGDVTKSAAVAKEVAYDDVAIADRSPEQKLAAASDIDKLKKNVVSTVLTDEQSGATSTMLQKKATCSMVEKQLRQETSLSASELHDEAQRICANVLVDATFDGHPIASPLSEDGARTAIVIFREPAPSSSPDDVAAAWRAATEKVLAAIPRARSAPDMLCPTFGMRVEGVRCADVPGGAVIEFNGSFALGKSQDRRLEVALAGVADVLAAQPSGFGLLVNGFASLAAFPCAQRRLACGDEKNRTLADKRAAWAAHVLRRRLASTGAIAVLSKGIVNPVSFDTPSDRTVRIRVSRMASAENAAYQ